MSESETLNQKRNERSLIYKGLKKETFRETFDSYNINNEILVKNKFE